MKQFLRFSVSGLLGFIITAALFIGMLSLLSTKKSQVKTTDTNINFSFVKDYKEPAEEPIRNTKKPEQQELTQAPAMPSMNLDNNNDPGINLPMPGDTGKTVNLLKEMIFPGLGDHGTGFSGDNPGGIQSSFAPMYPQKALITKTEGWVQVMIDVNEFGRVSAVTVLNAKPARVFNNAAIKAIKKWRFHPKIVDGTAAPYQVTQTVEFKLDQ